MKVDAGLYNMFAILEQLIQSFTSAKRLTVEEQKVLNLAAAIVGGKVNSYDNILYGNWDKESQAFLIARVSAEGIQIAALNEHQLEELGLLQVCISEYGVVEYNSPDGYGKYLGCYYEYIKPYQREYSAADLEVIADYATTHKLWI
jgi:hypothetical protein